MAASGNTFNLNPNPTETMTVSQHSFFSPNLQKIVEDYCFVDSSVSAIKNLELREQKENLEIFNVIFNYDLTEDKACPAQKNFFPVPLQKLVGSYCEDDKETNLIDKHNLLKFVDNDVNLRKYFTNEQIEVIKLLNHVVRGEKDAAEKLIQKNPQLLLCEGIVTDYAGRNIKGTALKIALGAEDVNIQEQKEQKVGEKEEGMVEMIMRYMRQLQNGEAVIKDQIKEQFPAGWEREEKKREDADEKALNTILKAIEEAKATTFEDLVKECQGPLDIFRKHFTPKGLVENGKHFNTDVLLKALERYDNDDNYRKFGDSWDAPKNLMLWRMVIGFIERSVPACLAQAFSQGIYYIVDNNKEKLSRTLEFRNDRGSFYFPLDSDPSFRLGYDYAGRGEVGRASVPVARRRWRFLYFKTYVEQKHHHYKIFMPRPNNPTSARCVIL